MLLKFGLYLNDHFKFAITAGTKMLSMLSLKTTTDEH